MVRLRAQYDGKVIVPLDTVDLPTGRVLHVEIREDSNGDSDRGVPSLLLDAMRRPPHLQPADISDLERAIETSKLAIRYDPVFDGGE